MKLDKIISIFLLLMFFTVLLQGIPAYAESHVIVPRLVFDKRTYLPGDTVTVSLALSGTRNTDKTDSVSFIVGYDKEAFQLENNDPENDIEDGYIKFTAKDDVAAGATKTINLMYANMSADTSLKEGQAVFKIRFKVMSRASQGAKVFTLYPVKMYDSKFNSLNINNGKVYSNAIEIGTTSHIKVIVNGQLINFDVPPQIIKGRTLVPLRKIFETLGAKVDWNDATKTVIGTKGDTTVKLKIGSTDAMVNTAHKTLDVPAVVVDGRTMVPARFVSECLGAIVDWDGNTNTVLIAL